MKALHYSERDTKTAGRKAAKIRLVMREFKHGRLRSSSGVVVRGKAQALKIALSESRKLDKKKRKPRSSKNKNK